MRGRLPKAGSYTGTGAAQSILCGWKPVGVLIFNETDGNILEFHCDSMSAAKGASIKSIADDGNTSGTSLAANAANGVTLHAQGFLAGTDVSVNAKVYRYIAW